MVAWTLPECRQLLSDIVNLVAEYSWIYEFHGTQILSCGVLNALPQDWSRTLEIIGNEELNGLAGCQSNKSFPPSLKRYLKCCNELSIHSILPDVSIESENEEHWVGSGVYPKKIHEVYRLCHLVESETEETGASAVLDIGSGLGYVDTLLHHKLGLRVLGVESEAARVKQATARHVKVCGKECLHLQYRHWLLKEDRNTVQETNKIVGQLVQSGLVQKDCGCELEKGGSTSDSVLLLGLHSCADLSPLMMRLFMCCSNISSLLLVSCCYHKMKTVNPVSNEVSLTNATTSTEQQSDDDKFFSENNKSGSDDFNIQERPETSKNDYSSSQQQSESEEDSSNSCELARGPSIAVKDKLSCVYRNFPLSRSLGNFMCMRNFQLSVYGLRLACQEAGVRWLQKTPEDHQKHINAMLFRGVLDEVCTAHDIILVRKRSKCSRKLKFESFENYLATMTELFSTKLKESSNMSQGSVPTHSTPSLEDLKPELLQSYEKHRHVGPLLEGLTGLQLALQGVLEALILLDRVAFSLEAKFCSSVHLTKIFDANVSPRCVAMILRK